MIHFVLLISRQGKVRLTKWYSPYSSKEKARTVREVSAVVLSRQQKQCNFLEYKDKKVSADDIKNAVSMAGYSANEVAANPESYEALPACCKGTKKSCGSK